MGEGNYGACIIEAISWGDGEERGENEGMDGLCTSVTSVLAASQIMY